MMTKPFRLRLFYVSVLSLWVFSSGSATTQEKRSDSPPVQIKGVFPEMTTIAGHENPHEFPPGFSAHWIRVKVDAGCRVTVYFVYT